MLSTSIKVLNCHGLNHIFFSTFFIFKNLIMDFVQIGVPNRY